jgi:HEAT repeat protein
MNTVRALLKDPNPEIRRQAAELLAPHDADTARQTLEPLLKDPNPAEREAAGDSYLRHVATDIPTLRTELRSGDSVRRVRAAARLLDLTR